MENQLRQNQTEDQKKLSESLVAQQEQLEAIFEAQQDVVLLYDPGMNVQRANHAFQETYGFNPVGMNVKEIVKRVNCRTLDGQLLIWDQQPTPLALRGEKVTGMRYLVRCLDGNDQVVQTSASPIWRGKEVIGSVTVWHDITGIKQAEQALQAQQDILRGILDATQESVWLFDPDGIILAGNQTALSRMNLRAEEVIGKDFKSLLEPDLAQFRQERLQEVVETKLPLEFEDQRAGIFFHHTFCPIIDAKGIVTSVASFGQDISESKRAEAALKASEERLIEANADLERKVRKRTIELERSLQNEKMMRQQLIQSEKFSALARLVASVAHEINNPLQTVQNTLFLLDREITEPTSREILQMGVTESRRIASLVQQLRETYRPADLMRKDFNLIEVLREVQNLMAPQFRQNNIQYQMNTSQDVVLLHGVPDQLKQVFLNICLNAVDAMASKGGQIWVDVSLLQDSQQVCLSLHNNGPSILPQHIDKIFEPFFTTKEKGTGLGLAISYEIIKTHQGAISVESPPGAGTTFKIILPLKS